MDTTKPFTVKITGQDGITTISNDLNWEKPVKIVFEQGSETTENLISLKCLFEKTSIH